MSQYWGIRVGQAKSRQTGLIMNVSGTRRQLQFNGRVLYNSDNGRQNRTDADRKALNRRQEGEKDILVVSWGKNSAVLDNNGLPHLLVYQKDIARDPGSALHPEINRRFTLDSDEDLDKYVAKRASKIKKKQKRANSSF
jgi:hypothetical protein